MHLARSPFLRIVGFSILFAVFLALFTAVQSVKAAGGGCYDITGMGTEVLFNNVPNSGVVHFGPPPPASLAPILADQACVEDTSANPPVVPAGDGPFTVKGWAWNDNLGWISMYCDDEDGNAFTPYTNLGIQCGNFQYAVMMEGEADANPGRLSGYAWGDNTGWINFSCVGGLDGLGQLCGGNTYYVEAETTFGSPCLGEVFSTAHGGCPARPNASTFAWSDNVGWIDLEGVKFPWVDLMMVGLDADFEIQTAGGVDPSVTAIDKLNAPIGDGSDSYEMILHLTHQYDGSAMTEADYALTVQPTWTTDTVDTDQTNVAFDGSAVSKPIAFPAGWGAFGASIADAYIADVTSRAPTSSMNGYDEGADGSVDSFYERFVLGNPNDPLDVPLSELMLADVRLAATHTPSGICAFGGVGCAPISVAGAYAGQDFHFVPAVEIDTFINTDPINPESISARHQTASTLNYSTACRGTLSGCPGSILMTTGVTSPFELVYDQANDGADCNDQTLFNLPFAGPSIQLVPVFEDAGGGLCKEEGPGAGDDAFVYSTVEYNNGGTIKYFSNKLPRKEGTLVVNPVAEISGNVYSTGVTNPQTGQEVRSLGDVSTNILRNTIAQNIEKIIAGIDFIGGSASITGWNDATGFLVTGPVEKLILDIGSVPKVYYFNDDVTISNDLSWKGERTIIVEGGDLFIDGNLYNAPVPLMNPKLGIIVMKDLSSGIGGNVYIDPNVLNIQANIYADGSLFSYDGNHANINGVGEPIWTDEATRFNTLKNQLYVQGSIASLSTIGGAVKTPNPILGDGTPTNPAEGSYGAAPTGRSQARLYDLNFLRYYGLVFARHTAGACIGDAIDQQNPALCPGAPGYNLEATSYALNPGSGDLVPITGGTAAAGLTADQQSAVYIDFDPPTATLPGFGVSSGIDIRIRP